MDSRKKFSDHVGGRDKVVFLMEAAGEQRNDRARNWWQALIGKPRQAWSAFRGDDTPGVELKNIRSIVSQLSQVLGLNVAGWPQEYSDLAESDSDPTKRGLLVLAMAAQSSKGALGGNTPKTVVVGEHDILDLYMANRNLLRQQFGGSGPNADQLAVAKMVFRIGTWMQQKGYSMTMDEQFQKKVLRYLRYEKREEDAMHSARMQGVGQVATQLIQAGHISADNGTATELQGLLTTAVQGAQSDEVRNLLTALLRAVS